MTSFADFASLEVLVDGERRAGVAAAIPVWDRGFLYGDGCFEGLRVRDSCLFRPHDHFARLHLSARALNIVLTHSTDDLIAMTANVLRANGLTDAHVRVILTRGEGVPGVDPRRAERPRLVVLAYPLPPLLGECPVDVVVSSVTRKAPKSVDAHIKSLNYLDAVLAKQQAITANAADAIMLDDTGVVADATGANVFVVRDRKVATPTTRAALPGITRLTVIELLAAHGIHVDERDVTWGELYAADECFLTGTATGIVAVRSIDGRVLSPAPGELTQRVAVAYAKATAVPELIVDLRVLPTESAPSVPNETEQRDRSSRRSHN